MGDHRTAVPQKLYGSQAVKCRKDYYVCMKPSRRKEFACKSVINQIARLLVDLRSVKRNNKYQFDTVTKMNSQQLRGSLAGMYFNKQRVEKINTPLELLDDYRIRRTKKKDWESYISFLNSNKSECLEIAKDILFIRKSLKTKKQPTYKNYEKKQLVQIINGVHHHYI